MYKVNDDVTKALKLSMKAHAGQRDKAGEEYFLHPLTVALTVAKNGGTDECIAAALLHDVVEDTDYTLKDLSNLGFDKSVTDALALLTHKKDIPYMDYVRNLKTNEIARAVKMADLLHNMDLSRLKEINESDRKRAEKYACAFKLLEEEENR